MISHKNQVEHFAIFRHHSSKFTILIPNVHKLSCFLTGLGNQLRTWARVIATFCQSSWPMMVIICQIFVNSGNHCTLTRKSPRWFVITPPRGSVVNTSQLSVSLKMCFYKVVSSSGFTDFTRYFPCNPMKGESPGSLTFISVRVCGLVGIKVYSYTQFWLDYFPHQ